jgi:hypothetical protein
MEKTAVRKLNHTLPIYDEIEMITSSIHRLIAYHFGVGPKKKICSKCRWGAMKPGQTNLEEEVEFCCTKWCHLIV